MNLQRKRLAEELQHRMLAVKMGQKDRKPIMNLQRKRLAEELQHGMLAVKIGQKVGVIMERDLHQERSQRLVAFDGKPESRLRKEKGDRKVFRKKGMISRRRGHMERVMAAQASPMMC